MRTIERSTAFKRDYRRLKKTPRHAKDVEGLVATAVGLLQSDKVLPESSRDHSLSGDWIGCRECHIKPDLLLVYRKPDARTLWLVRLGSHSELFSPKF